MGHLAMVMKSMSEYVGDTYAGWFVSVFGCCQPYFSSPGDESHHDELGKSS